jgi:hypothetical protein
MDNSNNLRTQAVDLIAECADTLANLLNDGDPFRVWQTEPGSLARANELKTKAKKLRQMAGTI